MVKFGFRDLEVWKKAITFANKVISVTEELQSKRNHFRLIENIEMAATSIAANIAEGGGRHSRKEFTQFLYIARGSLYETVTLLEIFRNRNWISTQDYDDLLQNAEEIVKMIAGLINSLRR